MTRVVLVHSPLVGASSWRPVAERLRGDVAVASLAGFARAEPPRWRFAVDRIVALAGDASDVALVGHSGAGPLLPAAIGAIGDAVTSVVFVDAPVPPEAGTTGAAPDEFRSFLRTLTRDDGTLPPWSRWWGDDVLADLLPDPQLRADLEADMESLPLTYFDEVVPVPDGWSDRRVTYVQLSAAYEHTAGEARARGWHVERIAGTHMDLATRPDVVAPLIERAVGPDAV